MDGPRNDCIISFIFFVILKRGCSRTIEANCIALGRVRWSVAVGIALADRMPASVAR